MIILFIDAEIFFYENLNILVKLLKIKDAVIMKLFFY